MYSLFSVAWIHRFLEVEEKDADKGDMYKKFHEDFLAALSGEKASPQARGRRLKKAPPLSMCVFC